jgi:hypothetical protein
VPLIGGDIFGTHFDPMPDVMTPAGPMRPGMLIFEAEGRPDKYARLGDNIARLSPGSRYDPGQVRGASEQGTSC